LQPGFQRLWGDFCLSRQVDQRDQLVKFASARAFTRRCQRDQTWQRFFNTAIIDVNRVDIQVEQSGPFDRGSTKTASDQDLVKV